MSNGDVIDDLKTHLLTAPIVPFTPAEVTRIMGYAESIREAFASDVPHFGYTDSSVKFLSDSIDAERSVYSEDDKVRIANLYGAFLGRTILENYPTAEGKWVRYGGDVGILFVEGTRKRLALPINRVFKHIEDGPRSSMHLFYMAIPQFLVDKP